jgi:DtxR family Mn-dependent transcriptional regulator
MDEILGFPLVDPHGSPIPDKNGNFVKPNYKRLSQFAEKAKVVIKALQESSTEFLLFLNKKSIQLDTKITIEHIEKFDDSITISYDDKKDVVLSKAICDRLLVEEI